MRALRWPILKSSFAKSPVSNSLDLKELSLTAAQKRKNDELALASCHSMSQPCSVTQFWLEFKIYLSLK